MSENPQTADGTPTDGTTTDGTTTDGTSAAAEAVVEVEAPPEEVTAELAEDMHIATGTREPILVSSGVTMQFGGLRALSDVNLSLHEGEIIGLIGPNGAGKTTFFNCLTGLYTPTSGQVTLRGRAMPQDPARVTEAGVARTFQNIRLFPSMTATENVLVGRHVRMKQGPISSLLHGPRFRRSEAEAAERAEKLLAFVGLTRFSDELARNLPYGDQRRLEIARALATDPSVLLLDEPTAGMNAQETEATRQLIFAIRDLGVSVVVIEHDTKFIFTLCDRVLVLVQGELLVEGSPDEVRGDPRVVEAYLGAPPEEVSAQLQTGGAADGAGTAEGKSE
ncbi:ABC transporter ATP-binding protein [Pseudonocardia halophobica]|uniref:ABC transporter ATP-binding protein n=1 Tax=Pseudonocardia halophobica TaxID=29401 RepID=A0A9W6L4M5_9PSEU|nr:ABC transporter ATP-binding protein [Pseudonocardia halophobica]GLL13163.1 ABC transporter ATP-binding protein [Pseudonocardia halophobica]